MSRYKHLGALLDAADRGSRNDAPHEFMIIA
jgi:hypothetical protein